MLCHASHDMPVLAGDVKARLVAFTLMLAVRLCIRVLPAILKASCLIIFICLVDLLCKGISAVNNTAALDAQSCPLQGKQY